MDPFCHANIGFKLYTDLMKIIIAILFTAFAIQIAYGQDQEFPFDKQCLKFDKSNFKVGQALLDVMTTGDFPQYCVLYSLSNYKIKQKRDDGYFIIGSKLDPARTEASFVFLKSSRVYPQNQILEGHGSHSSPIGQWAYFLDEERFVMENGTEKEFYVFQEIDF